MYLFFDTETTGLPRNWKAPVTDLNNWPRMVQIAWILCDDKGNRVESADYIIKPENFVIPQDASRVHGITTEKAINEGDADGIVDGIIDLMVVSIGTLDAFDVDSYKAWNRVHDANMSKEVGIKASRPNPLNLPDLIKPVGWSAPSHKDNIGLFEKIYK